MLTLILEEE